MHFWQKARLIRLTQVLFLIFLLAGCAAPTPLQPTPSATSIPTASPSRLPSPTPTETPSPSPSPTATVTVIPTQTLTPTLTITPTITLTATITPTATPDYPDVSVKMQANCRYGPGTAYLYRWGLYPGDMADVRGRNWDGSWFWIHPFNLPPKQNCWASKIVFNESVDISKVHYVQVPLPHTTFAGPPGNVRAVRNGKQVTVSWDPVQLSDDKRRGYLIEAQVCENNLYYPRIIQTDDTEFTFTDEQDCKQKSGGLLYTAEKHGYSDPVKIPWP